MDHILQKKHEVIAREIAAAGMVLLENQQHILPLAPGSRIALFGTGQHSFSSGGTGAAAVKGRNNGDMAAILSDSPAAFQLEENILALYRQQPDAIPTAGQIAAAADTCDIALVIISRNAGEGSDRKDIAGDFRLSEDENTLLERLGNSAFKHVAVVVNSGGIIELGWFGKYSNFHALLLCWQPGSEGVAALAEILCGVRNPSGHLTDTIASRYCYWPSAEDFQKYRHTLEYTEDVYVGYRYFETIPHVQDQVLYPFGYGLSYTTFSIHSCSCQCADKALTLQGKVSNTGQYPGREVIQCYVNSPGSNRPKLELKSFCKTGVIQPGESADFTLTVPIEELKRFDESGEICGKPGSFVLEKGDHNFFCGNSIRNLTAAGVYTQEQTVILSTPGNIFQTQTNRTLRSDGSFRNNGSTHHEYDRTSRSTKTSAASDKVIMLSDVAQQKYSIEDFIAQLSNEELIHLCCGQPPELPRCTGGIGNLQKYGICNIQTADGPAGIRCCYPATWFPCAVSVACSWDPELQFAMGQAIAEEGLNWNLDILLAPGLNIHRDPLCGRNFEYFSEDPLVSGCTAAALVKGVQSTGMGATIKHFACNSRETSRRLCNSIISERALREIYLKGFEIAVKTAQPWCVMSSYNLINGTHSSSSYALLTQLLRNEWGFDGAVMTDWLSIDPLWKELAAGNDLKMPVATREDVDMVINPAVDMDQIPLIPRSVLETSVRRILQLIMKSYSFKNQRTVLPVKIAEAGGVVNAMELCNISHGGIGVMQYTAPDGQRDILYDIKTNYWRSETAVYYLLQFQKAGTYSLSLDISTSSESLTVQILLNGNEAGKMPIKATTSIESEIVFQEQGDLAMEFPAGIPCCIKLLFEDPQNQAAALANLTIKKL